MRALRVVGVTGDGSVVLEDPGRRERYTVPADEQLRAAARGDVTRLGQIAIELESQLRPREIQARIRGGASVDEVAAAAGVPTQKIERFAYPVLLERSRTAELAQGAHPQRADGPNSRTLGETVAHTFGLRGQDYASAGWDSWKGEDGKWVVVLTWQTGRSDNAARWAFQPGAHGGTVVALDEHASDLIEGLPARPLRPLGAVVDMARDEDDQSSAPAAAKPARAVAGGQAPAPPEAWAGRGIAPEQRRSSPPRPQIEPSTRTSARTDETRPPAATAPVIPRTDPDDDTAGPGDSAGPGDPADPAADATVADASDVAEPVTSAEAADAGGSDAADGSDAAGAVAAPGPAGGPQAAAAPSTPAGNSTPGTPAPGSGNRSAGAPADPDGAATRPTSAPATSAPAGSAPATSAPATSAPPGSIPADPDAADSSPAASARSASDTGGNQVHGIASQGSDSSDATPPDSAATGTAAPRSGTTGSATATGSDSTGSDSTGSDDTGSDDTGSDDTGTAAAAAAEQAPRNGTPASDEESGTTGTDQGSRQRGGAAGRRTKKGKPVMPSWDEVLLGVRGQR
ncbi:hypothetical protein Ae168Ps1_3864c [Pseudonocardia sp. Ae168_Ps1]|uniref:septation protein SepH n=1 Tax=unclassified Pseudonocardia TaxID=2619320 RepID=UPI00096309AB|nr:MULTISPECIES: septation protein SepH [unclassified Pseudonocardia]OLL75463.1 hypothetical protein Ae150APs1_3841c [Pseudonocardia sp. Ae150A_Ps1]OLL81458.1 hypothetical protein Ae168Ps1_3864c [Pseudonocardia sp. Ae168_Ps1]OLL84428.1 hypothetical protein Ae263Ps1_1483 [Pseudonocardia sp. Ae263_Ps1]OLL95554.1 hypothetical protein Ae356Ps1_5451c [Pseudonocardia sp. Ae356_Ps1]